MSDNTISVLTLVKGRAVHLARLIEGLCRSDVLPAEVIVVDLDGGYEPPRLAQIPLQVVALPSANLPLAKARNCAAAAATSDALLFLDVDCIPRRSLVGMMAWHCARTAGLICAETRYLGPGAVPQPWCEERLLERAALHPVRRFPGYGLRRETNYGLFWSLAFGISSSSFAQLGGFDEDFEGYGAEDTDFGYRAQQAALGLYFLGGTGALHQYHDVYDPPLQHFNDIVRNAQLFHRKWHVWPMDGWLAQFQQSGFIEWHPDTLRVLRVPTAGEISAARVDRAF